MDILIGNTARVENDLSKESISTPLNKKTAGKDRRKNEQDRRIGVREGILVSLSSRNNQRALRDRRKFVS